MIMNTGVEEYLASHQQELLQLIRDLCAIPAPSHHEEARAEFCLNWFHANGCPEAFVDEALNVIAPYGVTEEGPVTLFCAHTDTVFPDTQPLPFYEDADRFYCPGVCDDTANLAILMICARYFFRNKPKTVMGLVFVANSCEEGLGNLKGCRALAARFGSRMQEFITFDGFQLNFLNHIAVGSHRYRVTVKTEGGHSFEAFGNRNAIANLASMICTLYNMKVPEENGSKTTYNVGIISGGTSVNTIAQEAAMLYEYRSDNKNCLAIMEAMFHQVVEAYRAMGIAVEVERIGERPCGDVEETKQLTLLNRLCDSVRRVTGLEPDCHSGSTDCNIPMSLGIPAVCVSLVNGKGIHTRSEELELSSLPTGCRLCMDVLLHYICD